MGKYGAYLRVFHSPCKEYIVVEIRVVLFSPD